MLKNLNIKNYALIKGLEISPSSNLNIVTGETGAGKSIILGAVGLLLGKRADSKILLDKNSKCVIEGIFDISNYQLEKFFSDEDLDYEKETIIRREINANGKSRAFINDLPVKLDVLSTIGTRLLDIHSQNDTLKIGGKVVQLGIVDDYAQNIALRNSYHQSYRKYQSNRSNLDALLEKKAQLQKDADYNSFLLNELTEIGLSEGEQSELENELKLLDNAEEVKLKLSQITNEFYDSSHAINDRITELNVVLSGIANVSEELETLSQRFGSSLEELKDIVQDLSRIQDSVEYDPARIEEVKDRLSDIYRLQQKHQVSTLEELIDIQSKLESEAMNFMDIDGKIQELEGDLLKSEKQLIADAEALSESRRDILDNFASSLNKQLKNVGLPEGNVEIAYKRIDPVASGIDEINMLFSANKGIQPQPVQEVASGGEFSRLMFCVKYLLADKTALPTIVFDEIDTGVSGEIAKKLATMMSKMSQNHQVISISHQPQIAAKGDAHYYVYKDNTSDISQSVVKKLNKDERLEEIAKMIGGDNPSEAAMNNAKELLEVDYAQ